MFGRSLMKANDLVLRCYVEREQDGSWFAVCLDLNLTAQADSSKEVKSKLHALIAQYVKEALTTDKEYINDLVPRKAPAYFFARYYMIKILCTLRGMSRRREERIFNEHLPVVPA